MLPVHGVMVRIRGTGRIWGEARIYSVVDGAVAVCHELETYSGEIGGIHGHRWWPLERKEGEDWRRRNRTQAFQTAPNIGLY